MATIGLGRRKAKHGQEEEEEEEEYDDDDDEIDEIDETRSCQRRANMTAQLAFFRLLETK